MSDRVCGLFLPGVNASCGEIWLVFRLEVLPMTVLSLAMFRLGKQPSVPTLESKILYYLRISKVELVCHEMGAGTVEREWVCREEVGSAVWICAKHHHPTLHRRTLLLRDALLKQCDVTWYARGVDDTVRDGSGSI